MDTTQLRQGLRELNGERDVRIHFSERVDPLQVRKALLIPEEPDKIVKLTDGQKVYLVDPARVAWIEIG